MPNLNTSILAACPFVVPSLPAQRAIAHILGTLDDKIELNRRMNRTLEAMARVLFKSWFVDFDPVRAKAEGRAPGLPKPIADIFPDRFEDSELGEIPEGWEAKTWGDLVILEYGKSLRGYGGSAGVCPVYGTNGEIGYHSEPLCTHPGIIIGRKGAYRGVHFCSEPFFVIDTAFYVEPRKPVDLRWAYYELLRRDINSMDSGSASDLADWQPHIRTKSRREALANRFRDAADPLRMVLVRDMWLTGFDAPSLHTMYVDKTMRGHGLMQAIARVNRVFKDKPGGLVVDYLGLAHELKAALATYTESGGTGRTALDQDEAVAVMLEKHEVCCGLFHGFDWSQWTSGTPPERLGLLPAAQEHILQQENGEDRCVRVVRELSQAFALAVPHAAALRIRDDVAFFQALQTVLAKRAPGEARSEEELDHAVRQIISRAVAPEGVVDIFAAAGLEKPDISILSEEFLAEVRSMPQKNLAVELLRKLLQGELRTQRRQNVVQARSFAEMLEQTIRRYQNRAIEAALVIEELIQLAQDMRQANARGEVLGLSEDELAFYDALETNDSAVQVLRDATLRAIAQELVRTVRANVTIDWTLRENVRAQLRVLVKRILRKHGYPPDKQEQATHTVLEQAEVLSAAWASA